MEMNLVVISKRNFVHKATEEKKLFSANQCSGNHTH